MRSSAHRAERRSRRVLRGAARVVLGVAVVAGAVACRGKQHEPVETSRESLLAVSPPADLLAEGTIATPDAVWQRLQRGVGGGAGLLPTTLGGLVCAAAGLDTRLGSEINGESPAYLVVAGALGAPSWVLASRLVEERRAKPLYEGASAIFDAKDAGGGVLELAPKGHAAKEGGFVGVAAGGWVVVGSSFAALGELGPYATRSVPAKAPPAEAIGIDIPQAALKGAIPAAIRRAWTDARRAMLEDDRALRDAHGGRAPDFGDPKAIVDAFDGWVETRLGVINDLRGAHIGVSVGADDVKVALTAAPASPDGAASAIAGSLRPGDLAPLEALPPESLLAILTRDDAAERTKDAASLERALVTTLGSRLAATDAKRVHTAIDDWFTARGDWATIALTLGPTERNVVANVAANDPARASRAVREGVDLLLHVPAIHEPFGALFHVGNGTYSTPEAPGGERASMTTFATEHRSPFALAWTPSAPVSLPAAQSDHDHGRGELRLALGDAPLPLLAPARGATLGADPILHTEIEAIGPAATAIVAQPGRTPGCNAAGGIVVAWGTRAAGTSEEAVLAGTMVASDAALRCAARSLL